MRHSRLVALAGTAVLVASLSACVSGEESADTSPPADSGEAAACDYPAAAAAAREVEVPPADGVAGETSAVIATSAGDVAITLDGDRTPCTVGSFVSLAEQGYFDDTQCHRLTTSGIFVLQCGDPTGTGTGGPGYSYADELDGTETYPAGTVAMANAGADTNGSQFFLVYDESPLPPAYTVFGQLDEAGLATVQAIGAAGTDTGAEDGAPAEAVTITGVTIG